MCICTRIMHIHMQVGRVGSSAVLAVRRTRARPEQAAPPFIRHTSTINNGTNMIILLLMTILLRINIGI